jgi:hypothetical protein
MDDKVRTVTCPVKSFTTEVELITRWFAQCYRVEVDAMSGHAEWKRTNLPRAGSIGEQDSRLMHGLEACAMISNEILAEDRKRRDKDEKKKAAAKTAEQRRHGG